MAAISSRPQSSKIVNQMFKPRQGSSARSDYKQTSSQMLLTTRYFSTPEMRAHRQKQLAKDRQQADNIYIMCCDEMDNMEGVCDDMRDMNETYASNLGMIEKAYDEAYSSNVREKLIMRTKKQGNTQAEGNS